MKNNAMIFDVQRNSFVDGPGTRTTVFFKGCNLRCSWCHNPESQLAGEQILYYAHKCTDCGACRKGEPCPNDARQLCGELFTAERLLKLISKDKRFYDASGGGVTFSGGECMLQIDFLEQILMLCKQAGIHTAVDTAGYVAWERFERILPYTDLFLYDVKTMDPEVHREHTGADNVLILENLGKLLRLGKRVIVRFPVIPGVNDKPEEMERLNAFYRQNGYPEKTELLPYHALGEHKYSAVGREPPRHSSPTEEAMNRLRTILKEKI